MKTLLQAASVSALFVVLGVCFSGAAQSAERADSSVDPVVEGVSGEDAQALDAASPPVGCVYQRTQTKCIVFVKLCDELYLCPNGSEWWRGWEECGTCSPF